MPGKLRIASCEDLILDRLGKVHVGNVWGFGPPRAATLVAVVRGRAWRPGRLVLLGFCLGTPSFEFSGLPAAS